MNGEGTYNYVLAALAESGDGINELAEVRGNFRLAH